MYKLFGNSVDIKFLKNIDVESYFGESYGSSVAFIIGDTGKVVRVAWGHGVGFSNYWN
jgi:hypothetical protein